MSAGAEHADGPEADGREARGEERAENAHDAKRRICLRVRPMTSEEQTTADDEISAQPRIIIVNDSVITQTTNTCAVEFRANPFPPTPARLPVSSSALDTSPPGVVFCGTEDPRARKVCEQAQVPR